MLPDLLGLRGKRLSTNGVSARRRSHHPKRVHARFTRLWNICQGVFKRCSTPTRGLGVVLGAVDLGLVLADTANFVGLGL